MRLSSVPLPLATVLLLATGLNKVNAQVFPEGSNAVAVGYGFGTFLGGLSSNFSQFGDVRYTGTGPLYAKFEHAVRDNVGLGVSVAYAANQWEYQYDVNGARYRETTKRSTYSVLARFNYHFGNSDKFDPYLGMGLGYRNAKWTVEDNGPESSGVELKSLMPFGMELTLGARYFFAPNFGLYAEVGAAKSVGQVGLAVKF